MELTPDKNRTVAPPGRLKQKRSRITSRFKHLSVIGQNMVTLPELKTNTEDVDMHC